MKLVVLLSLLYWAVLAASTGWTLKDERAVETGHPALRVAIETLSDGRDIPLHIIWPDPARTRLIVLDNPENARRLDEAMRERGCLAGVNGGYFHPDTTPLGLVIAEGRELHPLERARLLSGLLAIRDGRPTLLRIGELSRPANLSDALQAGPFLVDRGRPVRGLEATKQAGRTVIVLDSAGRYGLIVTAAPITLAELAALLTVPGALGATRVERALNLDGGSSSALWARIRDGQVYLPELKRVRNFLCVMDATAARARDGTRLLSPYADQDLGKSMLRS